jgi:hypothetical protein
MSNLAPAKYLIEVIVMMQGHAPQEVKTFKIVKN